VLISESFVYSNFTSEKCETSGCCRLASYSVKPLKDVR